MDPLTDDDYAQLMHLLMTKDPRAGQIVKTLSPEENQAFYQWQQANKNQIVTKPYMGQLADVGGAAN
jgi:hypothetical protein